ncbi:energy transducer TonB [Herbaspirillum sp. HC18]|nr:energy transducer TonB [Herbaspirillum sp. HC18]
MNFAQQRQPAGKTAGLAVVVGLHLIFGYALMNGLGRKVVDVLKKPLDVAIIAEPKALPPPPPPPKVLVPQPKVVAPPPAFVPPPEVRVEAPPSQNAISVTSSKSEPARPVPAAPPAPAAPPTVGVGIACPNHMEVRSRLPYPAQAQQMGLSGEVVVEFTVAGSGQIGDVAVVKSTNRIFNSAATNAVNQLRCNGQDHDVRVRVPFVFRIDS